jgi:hypothetical protein
MIVAENKITNIYDLFSIMTEHEVILIYQGLFDQQMIKTLMSMTEMKLGKEQAGESVRKKVFNIMIEGLQNICKHQHNTSTVVQNPFLIISRDQEFYNIFTGNIIHEQKISVVREKLDFINSLTKEGLKEHYKTARLNSIISDVGGAGLGFIDMARKSENKLDYHFYDLDKNHSFFILHSKILNK